MTLDGISQGDNYTTFLSTIATDKNDLAKLETKRKNLETFKLRLENKDKELYKNLNFLQKHFFPYGKEGTQIIATEDTLEKLPLDFSKIDNQIKGKKNSIEKNIITYLCETDTGFAQLNQTYTEICSIDTTLTAFLEKIEDSLFSIYGAKITEAIDIGTHNIGSSLISFWNTTNAQKDIKGIKDLLPEIQKCIDRIKTLEQGTKRTNSNKITLETNDLSSIASLDLVLDLFCNLEVDVGSIFSLFALGNAEFSMEEFKKKLLTIQEKTNKIKKELKSLRSKEIQKMETQITTEISE